ncbi:hypothetical protein [Butyricimonas synergistica]|uniref:hypothetical protein n=1 Tax=Butyricimonas synergistica TaxID=544644 RepID=UPI0022E3E614|nr:hypothetical protein [Butyricimonas synergistica]
MLVKIRKPIQGYGYFGGEIVDLPDETTTKFVNEGNAILVPDTEGDEKENPLPEDLPARGILFENGFTEVKQIFEAKESLEGIGGIAKKTAEKIIKFCEEYEG